MSNVNRFTAALQNLDTFYVFEDFARDQADTDFIDTITDTGTVLVGDEANGVVTLTPSDGTVADNDEAYVATPNELFVFAAGRPIYARARLQFAEVTANKFNFCFGLQNAVGANSLVDDGGGPKVSGSTLAIAKIDGSDSYLRCYSACNGTSTVTVSNKSVSAGTWYEFEIEAVDFDGVTMTVVFKVDGAYLKDANGYVIRHSVAIASATEMQLFAGAKLGAGTNNDTLKVDYWYAAQKRAA